ncbi:MAG: EI24 domain-containing protein [Candidatus Paceibacterota bacterium]
MDQKSPNPQEKQTKKGLTGSASGLLSGAGSRINNTSVAILILLALFADALSLIPFVGNFVGPIFWVCASLYFWKKGCGFLKPGRLVTGAVSMIAELIPLIQELPTIVVAMAIMLGSIRLEDKTGISLSNPGHKTARKPLYQDGRRLPQDSKAELLGNGRNPNFQPLNIDGVRPPTTHSTTYSSKDSNYSL